MLRLPSFALEEPQDLEGALALLAEHGERAMVIAGGTDLVPNMKHGLFQPEVLVSLARIAELRGIREDADGALVIGAMTPLASVAENALVRERAPALAQAVSIVAGPQLRTMGTLGGNVMLDTRCQWYNQTYFWRAALGFCLKKDGTLCHVVEGGQKCVAAASNDSAPALMTLGAQLAFASPRGRRELPIDSLWKADGIWNKAALRDEILTSVRVPRPAPGHRGAYGKLRERASIDFPLLGVAARIDLAADGTVEDADLVVMALAARPLRVKGVSAELAGASPEDPRFAERIAAVAERAGRQCNPLANVPGDHEYRKAMVPVYVRRTIQAALERSGPVHAV